MRAKDYRSRARLSLDGKWGLAVGATLVASLLGGVAGSQVTFNFSGEDLEYYLGDSAYFTQSVEQSLNANPEAIEAMLSTFGPVFTILSFVSGVFALVAFILGGATRAGICRFNKNLYHNTEPKFNDIFTHYNMLGKTIVANILVSLFTVLWTFLFIIPGIIAFYAYSMTFYILDENPEMSAMDAIRASREMMKGHKWELFCLHFSFLGWAILAGLTLGIGILFYNPYYLAAEYAFYNQIAHSGEASQENTENVQITNPETVDVPVEETPVVEA